MAEPGRTLWLDPRFGAAGDMILGALVGLGAPTDPGFVDRLHQHLASLDVEGWTLGHEQVLRCSLAADRAVVETAETHHHRTWSSIDALLETADLPEAVRAGARGTFRRLGEVEAGIHRVDIDEVHFHEVGAVDAIVDIVGTWLAWWMLDIDEVVAGPVGLGSGTISAAHGRLPVPAPATAELLAGAPVRPVDIEAETVTPTGAALLATLADRWGPLPAGRLLATARGAGTRDPEHHPNVVSAHLVDSEPRPGVQAALQLTTNLDDVTPEVIGHIIARALAAGADDAWATPLIMKKSRPGVALHVLCRPDRLDELRTLVFAETGTLGMRILPVDKYVLDRRFETVTVRGHEVRIKIGPHGAKPEHDDLVALAAQIDVPLRTLADEARAIYNRDDRPSTSGWVKTGPDS